MTLMKSRPQRSANLSIASQSRRGSWSSSGTWRQRETGGRSAGRRARAARTRSRFVMGGRIIPPLDFAPLWSESEPRLMFTSVRTPRVYEHIVAQIEHAIFAGGYRCGDRLPPERELVRQFHASRVAVREALRTLEHRGLVEVRHGASGGHFVRQVDGELLRRDFTTLLRLGPVALAQLTEARLLIEPEVARLAAIRCTEGDVGTLRTAVEERAAVVMAGRPPRPLDLVFHRAVAAAARNP